MDYKKMFWTIGLTSLAAVIILTAVLSNPRWIVEVEGRKVYQEEALIYLRLTTMEFEEIAGENVWDLSLEGQDALQTAADNALDSMIRVKLLQPDDEEKNDESKRNLLNAKISSFRVKLGEEWIEEMDITNEMLYRILEENYWAAEYEENLQYDTGEISEDIKARVDNAFAEYDGADRGAYLQKVRLQSIMCYTGEWVAGRWVEYPEDRQEEKRHLMEELFRQLEDGANFAELRVKYDETGYGRNPLFAQGILGDRLSGYYYYDQIHADVADKIFRVPEGRFSEVLETEYGYLLVQVSEFPGMTDNDIVIYENALEDAKKEYRSELIETLRQEKVEEEIEHLRQEAEIEVRYTEWDKLLREYMEDEING